MEKRVNAPKDGMDLSDFSVDRDDIPLKIEWSKRKITMPTFYQNVIDKMLDFKSRKDDLWIVTVPKCGTTWMQETAWLVQNNFDFEKASSIPLTERSPFVE